MEGARNCKSTKAGCARMEFLNGLFSMRRMCIQTNRNDGRWRNMITSEDVIHEWGNQFDKDARMFYHGGSRDIDLMKVALDNLKAGYTSDLQYSVDIINVAHIDRQSDVRRVGERPEMYRLFKLDRKFAACQGATATYHWAVNELFRLDGRENLVDICRDVKTFFAGPDVVLLNALKNQQRLQGSRGRQAANILLGVTGQILRTRSTYVHPTLATPVPLLRARDQTLTLRARVSTPALRVPQMVTCKLPSADGAGPLHVGPPILTVDVRVPPPKIPFVPATISPVAMLPPSIAVASAASISSAEGPTARKRPS